MSRRRGREDDRPIRPPKKYKCGCGAEFNTQAGRTAHQRSGYCPNDQPKD